MASLELVGGIEGFSWLVSGLGKSFNEDNYSEVGLAKYPVTSGSSSIRGEIDMQEAPPWREEKYSEQQWCQYNPGRYTFYGFARSAEIDSKKYYPAGQATVVVEERITPPTYTITASGTSENSIRFYVNDVTRYFYFRFYIKKGTQIILDSDTMGGRIPSSQDFQFYYDKLEDNTTYTVNVGYYNASSGEDGDWIGSTTYTTKKKIVPTYWYSNLSYNSVTFNVRTVIEGRYFRFRIDDMATGQAVKIYDSDDYGRPYHNTDFDFPYTGLKPKNPYNINVGYSYQTGGDVTWIGVQSIITPDVISNSYVCIGGSWKKAIPYVYTAQGGWQKALPYINIGTQWKS